MKVTLTKSISGFSGLMYDEMHAYQNNFLDQKVLVDWMTWQMYEHGGGEFTIGAVSYDDKWQWWLTTPAQYHEYSVVMKKIFACKDKECVRDAIEFSGWGKKWGWVILRQ
jgi:hypothetical protein